MVKLMRIFIGLLFCFSAYSYGLEDKLIFSIDLIRHGDRSPLYDFPHISEYWPMGNGELSALGMRQEFDLGKKLRKKYIEKEHLLPEQYLAETMEVYSTPINRTVVSAQSLLMGLYPPSTGPKLPGNEDALPYSFQPIPIMTNGKTGDLDIFTDNRTLRHEILDKDIRTSEEWITTTNQYAQKMKRWSEILEVPFNDLYDLDAIGDTLFIQKISHFPLPPKLSETETDEIIDLGEWVYVTVFNNKKISKILGLNILTSIQNYFKIAASHQTKLKYVLLSGHDINISALLALLEVPTPETPPYASDLNFSLYEKTNGETYIVVTFNDVVQIIPSCKTNCTLNKLEQLIKDL